MARRHSNESKVLAEGEPISMGGTGDLYSGAGGTVLEANLELDENMAVPPFQSNS